MPPHPPDSLDRALALLLAAVQTADDNIATSIEAWNTLQRTYQQEPKVDGDETHSFVSWGLANIDDFLIRQIGAWIHTAHFESLAPEKKTELRKIAKAFNTNTWMIYFVLGDGLIADSVKGLKLILRFKRASRDLTLVNLLRGLERARQKRRGIRSRNVSNDMTKFTMYDIKHSESELCPMPISPPLSVGSVSRDSSTPEPETLPSSPAFQSDRETTPAAPQKPEQYRHNLQSIAIPYQKQPVPAQPSGNAQPSLDTDRHSNASTDVDIEFPRGCAARLDNVTFGSDDIVGHSSPCVGQPGILRTPQRVRKPTNLSPTPQIYEHTELSPIHINNASTPSLTGSNDYGSEGYDSDVVERDDGAMLDNTCQASDSDSDFQMDIPEKLSQQLIRQWGKPGQLLIYRRVAVLGPRHLCELDDGQRLSDEMINYYIESLVESSGATSKVLTQTSFFYKRLRGSQHMVDYEGVSRWVRKEGNVTLGNAEYLILPIHDEASQHWFLVVAGNLIPGQRLLAGETTEEAHGATAFITAIDSLGPRPGNMRVVEDIRSYICHEARTKFGLAFDQSRIKIKVARQVLYQNNGTDCGIYVLEHTRRFLANSAAFLERIFRGELATVFDVAMMRAEVAGRIIQDKRQQDLDHRDLDEVAGRRQQGVDFQKGTDDSAIDDDVAIDASKHPQHHVRNQEVKITEKGEEEGARDQTSASFRSLGKSKEPPTSLDVLDMTSDNTNGIMDDKVAGPSKRRRTKAQPAEVIMEHVSPQMIVQLTVATKQLTQLTLLPLPEDLAQPDLVDRKIWRLVQDSITAHTNSICVPQHLGFPCVASLPEAFHLNHGAVSTNIHSYLLDAYLNCLSDYTSSAAQALISAQALRELIRRSRDVVRALKTEYDKDMEHLGEHGTASALRKHVLANAQKEMAIAMQTLEDLFERMQNIVGELQEYWGEVQDAQKAAVDGV